MQTLLSVLLLILYIGGNIGPDLIHQAVHNHEETEHHSPEQELDPCHRTVFHQDTSSGCEHQTHIFAGEDCDFQSEWVKPHQSSVIYLPDVVAHFHTIATQTHLLSVSSYSAYRTSLRGPPIA
ncbi:hypothetical protein PZB74_19630 [Porifericola rhodea]|uniref:hypothetical protein n=1 Tax=Porifericola rhodea TaxID=930972 RepID=UPI00266674E8|nr:hypothetical protein [Porifericola rhodea]WKN31165.1 hypothetical protein PZB74_19630 [Porifericola rhodea]